MSTGDWYPKGGDRVVTADHARPYPNRGATLVRRHSTLSEGRALPVWTVSLDGTHPAIPFTYGQEDLRPETAADVAARPPEQEEGAAPVASWDRWTDGD